ncbi:MAG: hypothetical protein IT186_25985 [Acidobacteria bacterium]|nr:hypothetical protein [Acidobacteriota bacterium]
MPVRELDRAEGIQVFLQHIQKEGFSRGRERGAGTVKPEVAEAPGRQKAVRDRDPLARLEGHRIEGQADSQGDERVAVRQQGQE